jgi:SAM-dependent methyltransferase
VLFWDTPVPLEHTFECSYDVLQQLCRPYAHLESAIGVSIGLMVPGWAAFLKRLPETRARSLMRRLDRVAQRCPRLADVVVTSWRPRAGAVSRTRAVRPPLRSAPSTRDPTYASRARAEAMFWQRVELGGGFWAATRGVAQRLANRAYTGDPDRAWIDDLLARGPFRRAASLGCDEGGFERYWLQHGGSARLDVYDLSPAVIAAVRRGLERNLRRRARFACVDLNFVRLPRQRYDVIWSSGSLHHVIDLEHLFDQVAWGLKPGGLFAIHDYVGEPRMRFAAGRLARANAVLRRVPARFRHAEVLTPPRAEGLSPFCGVRSDAVVPLAEARFEVVHKALTGALFPLTFGVDLAALEREAPAVLAELQAAEEIAQRAPDARPCGAYLVLRKRAAAA